MINLDHVDQATIYLSKTGLDVEIITSSTTGVNVLPYLSFYLAFRHFFSILFFSIQAFQSCLLDFPFVVQEEGC
jgi:Adenylate cyclase associated (CAP) C terminal